MYDRRSVIAATGLGALALPGRLAGQTARYAVPPPIAPILARPDRMTRVTVCLRPFRAVGPRIEAETIRGKRVVHNYGHGGSGWSLSWGSAWRAAPLAMAKGDREIAVIGAGVIGMTSAIIAQKMGAKVTIYAKERFPLVRSARATGVWSPSSRIAAQGAVAAGFEDAWEAMARQSYAMHSSYLGVAGNPVEWIDFYNLRRDVPVTTAAVPPPSPPPSPSDSPEFLELDGRVRDLEPRSRVMTAEESPFRDARASQTSMLTFNIAQYSRLLEYEFLLGGGQFVASELASMRDLRHVREKTVINCTGYGARGLMGDESIVPVRGQIAWLLPQADAHYGIYTDGMMLVGRRDGTVVQSFADPSYGIDNELPDMASAREAVDRAARIFG